jgi:hypothetical protein
MWNTDFPLGNKIIEAGKEYHVPNRENCSTVQEVFNGKGNINIWQWAYKGKPVDWLDTYKEMSEDSDVRKILIRLCGDLYGGQLAECMSEALLSGYLPPYTNNPEIWKFRSVNYINSYDKYNLQSMKKYNDRMTKAAAPFGTFLKNRSLPSVKSKEMQCEIWNVMFDLLEEKTKSAFWVILLTRKEKNNGVSEKELNETFDREVKSVRNILDLYKKFPADIKSEAKINRRILGLTKWLEHISMLDMSARMENNSDYPAPELVVNDNPEMRIAIYNPNSLGGKAYGFKPLFNTLNGSSGTEVSYINFISKESIKDFDCIYFPQVNKFGEKDDASSFFKDLRDFCKKGGNIYMLHDSVGYNRFALGCPVFSELASKIIMEKGDSYCTAVKHPLTSGIEPGTTLKHMYLDHFLLKDLKKAEAILINKNGDPVVAAARWGKGKIILDGTIPYGEKSECENAKDFNKQLIINSIEWFRSNKPEDLIVENSRVNVVRKTEHDAVHYYLEFFPRVISRNNFTGQVLEIGIADKKSNNIYSKSISLPQKERIWQPEETKMIFDLPVDPTGKYLVLKIIDKDGSEILSRKYIVMR